ncbi:MAG TPA: terminase, partial [Paraburkholderia sp.]
VSAIRMATASGHGIGKSTLVAWLVNWIMSTRPFSQGTVTANTFIQLQTKTWAAIQHWTPLSITAHWFRLTGNRMYHVHYPAKWFCSAQTCREENSEAFQGQHAATATSFYIFDEASAVPDSIFTAAEGGITDGEPMQFLFGNPTRNSGFFHRVTFGAGRPRWNHRSIDSRTSKRTNLKQIAEWVADYGEDSDFVRVRVHGVPPHASELQYIDLGRVQEAQKRERESLADEPLVAGCDVSAGGQARNVVRFRRGLNARPGPRIPHPIRLAGETSTREVMIAKLSQVLSVRDPDARVAALFVDSAFGAPIVERLHLLGFDNVIEVNFGETRTPDIHFANMRSYMWNELKEWLARGAIDRQDEKLEVDLTSPGYHLNRSNQLVLESKQEMQKRNVPPVDDADALALTFAQAVAVARPPDYGYQPPRGGWMS